MFIGHLSMYISVMETVKLCSSKYILQGEQCVRNQTYSYVIMMWLLISYKAQLWCVPYISLLQKHSTLKTEIGHQYTE